MPNPSLLICDSDALFQFFLTNELRPLQTIKKDYGIQPAIVPEVEIELSSTRKFGTRFESLLRKTISRDLIKVFDQAALASIVSGTPLSDVALNAARSAIQALGFQYYRRVGRGEAYTHATAFMLDLPALSNDGNAVYVLEQADLKLPSPVLRVFDLIAFSYDTGALALSECEAFLHSLRKAGERIPSEFRGASFIDGLVSFSQRLLDLEVVGTRPTHTGPPHRKPLCVSRIRS